MGADANCYLCMSLHCTLGPAQREKTNKAQFQVGIKKKAIQKNTKLLNQKGLKSDSSPDLCDSGAVLYQLISVTA